MNKTLVLSMVLCGSMSLVLGACAKDDGVEGGAATASTTASTGDGDGDAETGSGDGDGDPGDGDPSGDGDGDGMSSLTAAPFVPTFDYGAVSECDPFMQDCPEEEKCVPYSGDGGPWNANKCVPVMGSGSEGDPCTYGGIVEATDDCDAGTHCWDVMDVDGMSIGVCTPFCGGTPDDPICEPGTSCLIANDGSINLCIATCDPLLQECDDGLACFWANNGFNCIFTAGDIMDGLPCGYINDCAAGLICLDATTLPSCDGSACCGSFCDASDPDAACPVGGTECTPFFEEGMAPPTYEDVGVCIVPGA